MGVIIPVGEAMVSHQFLLAGDLEPMYVTYGIDPSSVTTDVEEMAIDIHSYWQSAWGPAGDIVNVYTLSDTTVRYKMDASGTVDFTVVNPLVGTSTGAPPPSNCAMLIKKVTSSGGRRNRGRMFMPPSNLGETAVDGRGVITPVARVALQGKADDFFEALELPGYEMRLFHSDGAPSTRVVSLLVDSTIATQRTRMR